MSETEIITRVARKVSASVKGAAVYELTPPLLTGDRRSTQSHSRVIVSAATVFETRVFPTRGAIRVLGEGVNADDALKNMGYEVTK